MDIKVSQAVFATGIEPRIRSRPSTTLTFWSSGSHERTVERKVEDLRRKLKTIVATLPLILPSHAYQDLVQHGAQCENQTTNYKGRPDCPEDMLRVHKGVNRLQFDLKEIVFFEAIGK